LIFAVSFLLISAPALAEDSNWRTSWDGTLYGYASSTSLRNDSVLNPNNQVAALPQRSDVADLRLNFKAENETLRLTARPIATVRDKRNAFGSQQSNESYFSQWQVRVRAAESWNVAAGREVMNWGAAQFRSPSSPFYFDNGRSDPMRELSGMDVVKLSWTPDMRSSVNLARITGSGYGAATPPDVWRNSWLAKFDRRGNDWAVGVVAVKAPDLPEFYGAHAQSTLSDELMLYGEVGSSAQPRALQSPADLNLPYSVQVPSARGTATLAGASYTFEDGKSLAAEYLHDDHGYTAEEESAYFQRATVMPGIALGLAPRLLGRDYLHLVWQTNMMESGGYWRVMYTRNLTDAGSEIGAYGETVLAGQVSAYWLALLPVGSARQEFSALFQYTATLGLKVALP
jgi:hypothetical protein